MAPFGKAELLQNPDTANIDLKKQGKECFDLQPFTLIYCMLHKRVSDTFSTIPFVYVVANFNGVSKSHSAWTIRA
ncbi:hypothetical protein QUF54_04225 [Candidatus Marithioploca araucensis]|uniref:Uncharacterized protein n=1 Tax=Candidatus Marithioploca araucensis TaxID=70273 RepID=A0ABT7VSA0_9GAMM|nr:hypothetical protein [Candidatus Marithioploca araucensis]